MKYFKGENKDELTMDLTTPTLAALKLSKDSQESERDYVFSLWLDPEQFEEEKEEPPKPNDENMEIKEYEGVTVFVRSFGGFATENTILNEVQALHEELVSDKEDFDETLAFVAVYDPAVKLLNRHNEVHVMKKPTPSVSQFMKGAKEARKFLVS
jgi:SOUL heme-binding protein